MKLSKLIITCIVLGATNAFCQDYTVSQFLNIQTATRATFSPSGTEVAYITNISGQPQVWRSFDRPGPINQLTFEEDGVDGVWWSPVNATQMIVSAARGGSEKSKLYLLNPGQSPLVPLVQEDEAIYRFGSWSNDGSVFCYATNKRNGVDFDVYEHHLAEAEPRLIYDGGGHISAKRYSADGRFLLMTVDYSNVNTDLLVWDRVSNSVDNITQHTGNELYSHPHFDHAGKNIFCISNKGREYAGITSYNLESKQWTWFETPDAEIEILSVAPDGSGYAFITNDNGYSRFNYYSIAKDRRVQGYRFPEGIIQGLTFSPDGTRLAVTFGNATKPFDIWIYEPLTDRLYQLTSSATGGVPLSLFVAPETVEYETFDGRKIPAYFYSPVGDAGKAPVIIAIHGGPESQARPDLSGLFQYWLHNGFAILEPNVRGSSGYGRTYLTLDDVQKRMDSVRDIEYAAKWLKGRKDIDGSRIVLYGGSYGGFMVLAGLTMYPDLFAAGIDVVGISNFVTFLENTGKYRRALREAEYGSLSSDRAFLESISPLNHVDKIKAPLFVIQGANDPRVPQSEADQMVKAIRDRGGIVEYLLFEDEGHGLAKTQNRILAYSKATEFLKKYISVKPE